MSIGTITRTRRRTRPEFPTPFLPRAHPAKLSKIRCDTMSQDQCQGDEMAESQNEAGWSSVEQCTSGFVSCEGVVGKKNDKAHPVSTYFETPSCTCQAWEWFTALKNTDPWFDEEEEQKRHLTFIETLANHTNSFFKQYLGPSGQYEELESWFSTLAKSSGCILIQGRSIEAKTNKAKSAIVCPRFIHTV